MIVKCINCGRTIEDINLTHWYVYEDGMIDYICVSCLATDDGDKFGYCDICGSLYNMIDTVTINGEPIVCKKCFERHRSELLNK